MLKSVSTSVAQFQSSVSHPETTQAIMNHITTLPSSLSCDIFNQWIELKDVARLDSAMCVNNLRPTFLNLLSCAGCVIETKTELAHRSFLSWLLMREIKVQYFFISGNVDEELGVQYMRTHGSVVKTIIREACRPTATQSRHFGLEIIKEACHYGNLTCLQYFGISVPFLIEVLSRCPSLQELHTLAFKSTTDNLTLPSCASLTDLRVYGDVRILLSIISVSPNLQKLSSLGGIINDAALIEIAEKSRNLRFLGLQRASCSKPAFVTMTTLCTEIHYSF